MWIKMFEDEFEQFRAYARRGSLPLPEPPLITIESSPRRTKSMKGSRKRKEFVMSPLVREEKLSECQDNKDNDSTTFLSQQLLIVPDPEPFTHSEDDLLHCQSRSNSCKKAKNPRNLQLQIESRPRSCSLPNVKEPNLLSPFSAISGQTNACQYRVRCFNTTSKGIVNTGDSIVRARSSNCLVASAISYGSGLNLLDSRRLSLTSQGSCTHSAASSTASSNETPVYKVLLLGRDGVGKTAVAQQFMTSEYMGAQNTSFDDEEEKTVSVLLDGEESIMDVIDVPDGQAYDDYDDADAYVVVFSVNDVKSFHFATDLIRSVRESEDKHLAVILVANKSDLVRSRQISEEAGKSIATLYDCKYIEVSVVLNHNVDELLVGILSQIRLNNKRLEKQRKRDKRAKDKGCVNKAAKGLLNKLLRKPVVSKSCDNLLVL